MEKDAHKDDEENKKRQTPPPATADLGTGDNLGAENDDEPVAATAIKAEVDPKELDEIFMKRYKMTKAALQDMADKMGIQLNNLYAFCTNPSRFH
jgi:hypothetical protein